MNNYIPFILIPFIGWGVRYNLRKKKAYTPLKRATLVIGLVCFFLTEMGRSFYRPYVYAHHIHDFFIADTLGNTFGTMTAIFMVITLAGSGTHRDWKLVVLIIAGLVAYECLNLTGRTRFDVNDVVMTLVFGCISCLIYVVLLRKYSGTSTLLDNHS